MPMLELKASFIVRPHLRDADAGNPMPQTQTHSACVTVPVPSGMDGWRWMHRDRAAGGLVLGLACRWNFAFAPTTEHKDEPIQTKQASRVDKTTNQRASRTCDPSKGLCHLARPMAARARTCTAPCAACISPVTARARALCLRVLSQSR